MFKRLYHYIVSAIVGEFSKAVTEAHLVEHEVKVKATQTKAAALKTEATALANINAERRAALRAAEAAYAKSEAEIDALLSKL